MIIFFQNEVNFLDYLTAFATVASSLTALWVVYKSEFLKAKFEIFDLTINKKMKDYFLNNGSEYFDVVLNVRQVSGQETKNVSIQVVEIRRNGVKIMSKLVNITWGGFEERAVCQNFAKGIIRQCTVGRIQKDKVGSVCFLFEINFEFFDQFDSVSSYLWAGDYEIDILLSGENARSLRKTVCLTVPLDYPVSDAVKLKASLI